MVKWDYMSEIESLQVSEQEDFRFLHDFQYCPKLPEAYSRCINPFMSEENNRSTDQYWQL